MQNKMMYTRYRAKALQQSILGPMLSMPHALVVS